MKQLKINTKESNGKVFKNIDLKELGNGEFIVVEKLYAEGQEFSGTFGKSYSCKALYNTESISFWLREKYNEHKRYADCGGVGDKVKIIAKEEVVVNPKTKAKMLVTKFDFELVNETN